MPARTASRAGRLAWMSLRMASLMASRADYRRTAMPDPLDTLRVTIRSAADSLLDGTAESVAVAPTLERPPKPELGDYSTNAAMLLAPALGEPPRTVAERLRDHLGTLLGPTVDRIEVAGPGFVNLFLADRWYRDSVVALLGARGEFGGGTAQQREPVLVEFVSANPTGPLHAASGRHAAYGDALARVLAFAGHDVQREYYLNDMGRQIRQFGESIAARMRGEEPPEDGYRGDYVIDLAKERADGRLIDVLGADHHGYLARMRAAIAALGEDPDRFEAQIIQMVHVELRGERTQMSKRQGTFVPLDELLDDIGTDATRFFMLQRSHETTVDVDLELARKESPDNPVYYVQYAHARIASILRKARAEGASRCRSRPSG